MESNDRPRASPPNRRLRNIVATTAPAILAVTAVVCMAWLALHHAAGSRRDEADAGVANVSTIGPAAAVTACDAPVNPAARSVSVEIPDAYELANIALALSSYAEREVHTIWRSGAYYEDVMQHFGAHRGHPLIRMLDRELVGPRAWNRYYSFRENAAAWTLQGDSIARVTRRRYWPGDDLFGDHIELVRDFARQADFPAFHRAHRAEYDAQLARYRERVDVRDMWSWIEARFPQRYQSYRVVFSPLIKGSHSTRRFDDTRETVMFIGGADIVTDLPAEQQPVALARIVFTEIDHNYVNPTSDRHGAAIARAFADVPRWNTDRNAYDSPYATFNEYMTWGIFSLYLIDRFPADIARRGIDALETQMHRRGFIRFHEFNRALLDIAARQGSACIPPLYPAILEWSAGS